MGTVSPVGRGVALVVADAVAALSTTQTLPPPARLAHLLPRGQSVSTVHCSFVVEAEGFARSADRVAKIPYTGGFGAPRGHATASSLVCFSQRNVARRS
jgi:hypothetical protein